MNARRSGRCIIAGIVTKHPGVTTALSSMNIREHAEANVAAMEEEPLRDDVFSEIRYYHRWIHNFYSSKSL